MSINTRVTAALLAPCLAVLVLCAPASAMTPRAGWQLHATTIPTNLAPGGTGALALHVFNVGEAASSGPVTVTDVLPEGTVATEAGDIIQNTEFQPGGPHRVPGTNREEKSFPAGPAIGHLLWNCSGVGTRVVTCTNNMVHMPSLSGGAILPEEEKEQENGVPSPASPAIGIVLKVLPTATGTGTNQATISGGGSLGPASTRDPFTFSAEPPPFGFTNWDVWFSNADGTLDTQAGSHPYEATFIFNIANTKPEAADPEAAEPEPTNNDELRNIESELPPGLIGDPDATPRCSQQQFEEGSVGNNASDVCPPDTVIGLDDVNFTGGGITPQLYNIVPPHGIAAEFGFSESGITGILYAYVRSGGDDGITEHVDNVAQRGIIENTLILWGVPADPSHDLLRGLYASEAPSGAPLLPLLTLPTACEGPQPFLIRANTWQDPNLTSSFTALTHDSNELPAGFTGCEALSFAPAITTATDTAKADTPAGLTVVVRPTDGGLLEPEGLSSSDIQNTTVTLPAGMAINPGQAVGLQACQPFQDGVGSEAEPACPGASKVGEVRIKTPLLENDTEPELTGNAYVLQSNPPNLKLLLSANGDGVHVKLVAVVHLDEQTGQITTRLGENAQAEAEDPELKGHLVLPQLPFSEFKLSFSGGAQAALATPATCGRYVTQAEFTPWAALVPNVLTQGNFELSSGPGGGACPPSPLPFSPTLTAGATTDQAGGFTNFSLLLQRGDGQQRIAGLQFKAPEGLTGELSKVPLCTNAQAESNTCPEASKIGHTVVESGPGPDPLVVPEPGQEPAPIYLTEAYGGAPFGLSIVVPLHVGPFVLPTQRVRAKIEINPVTTQLTITTNELPQIVAGVPTDLREVDAVIERPEFMVNPTNCNPQEFSGTAYGTPPPGTGGPGASAPISTHFGVGSCQSLKFEPKFSVSTPGKTTKTNGAGLTAKLTYPVAAQGTQSNITRVKVDLPKQLPSRLTTLQKACTNAQFELNPANCPKESKIGYATVHTPLLPVPVSGPAIFVSHGGEAFPSLTMVLQGDGVTVDLVGTTFISHAGITSTTFKTVPDVPFSSFELTLGQGKYSALAANLPTKDKGSFCGQKLSMPTAFVGQNGAEIHESTAISVSGCKSEIRVASQKVKGSTATIAVAVPAAGKLVATAKGLSKGTGKSSKTGTVTVKLTLTRGETALLAKHPGRKLSAKIKLQFTPKKGSRLAATTTVLVGG